MGGVGEKAKKAAGIAGVGALLGAKFYLGEKYLSWRARRKRELAGVGVGPAKFSHLSRKRQAGILAYKRAQVRGLENVYYSGSPRRRGMGGGVF